MTYSGVGASLRKRGLADIAQGRGGDRTKRVDVGRPQLSHSKGLTLHDAREYLQRYGSQEGWIVEVFPDEDDKEYENGDRWFRQITDGLVQGSEPDQYITATRWMRKNSVRQLDSRYPEPEPCEILSINAYGPSDCNLFK